MESQARLQGSGAWRFGTFSVVTALAVLAFAVVLAAPLPPTVKGALSGAGLIGAGLAAALSCRYRAAHSSGSKRVAWTLWALACAAAAVGNLLLLLNGATSTPKGRVAPQDIVQVSNLGLALAGMLTFPRTRRRATDLVRMTLDGVVIAGSILAVIALRVWPKLATMDPSVAAVSFAIPVIDIVVVTLATLLFLRGSAADRPTLGAAAAGFSLFAVSDVLYVLHLAETTRFQLGTPRDLGWIAGYTFIAWAVRSHPTPAGPSREARTEGSAVLGTATVFAVFVVCGTVSLVDVLQNQQTLAAAQIWAVVLLAVLGRQFFLVLDNEQLRRTLEQRVEERTRSLRQVTRQSDLLVNSVGDGIYGVDRYGLITFVNPAAAEALGYNALDLIGHDAHATFHAPSAPGVPFPPSGCYITEAIRDGVVTNAEEDSYLRPDGRVVPVEVTATPLTDDGVTLGAVVVFRDVTQRREVDRLKGEFVSMVSHELRTPLTAIRGSLGLLAGGAVGPLTPPAARMVDIALVSSERLTRLINEILDLERMEAGGLPMEVGRHSARELVESAVAQAAVLAEEAGVRLRVSSTEGEVRADADRVVQTLLNLVGNAIKFSEPGQEVTVQAARRGGFVEFEVSDSGRGIPEDKLDAVFARFQQVDSSDAREKGGSGLGLAISRSIVERLGGRIWAANNPEGGAVFHFTLPVWTPQPPDLPRTLPSPDQRPPVGDALVGSGGPEHLS